MANSIVTNDATSRLFTAGLKKKILLVPVDLLSSCSSSSSTTKSQVPEVQFSLEKLPHPRTGDLCSWAFNPESGAVFHLFELEDKFRSWFVGNYVLEDGTIKCLVPLDPLLLVLPYLLTAKKKKRFQPLRQIFVEENEEKNSCEDSTRALQTLSDSPQLYLKDLDLICLVKEFKDDKFFKLSRAKLAAWMKIKVRLLSEALEREHVNVTWRVSAAGFSHKDESQTKEQYERYAFGMLCDYIPPSLQEELAVTLNMGEVKAMPGTADTHNTIKKKKGEPAEDYFKECKPVVAVPEKKLTAAQKRLAKIDKAGMKSISSYFSNAGGSK